jgi:pimeloyl-ACP methyl ester carboxylesterase
MSTRFSIAPDGTRIAYDITGNGPALVLLHGAGKTRRDWHKLSYVARLEQDFTVITLDLRGAGDSDCPSSPADYAIEKVCADVYAVADACKIQRFALWGFSLGGTLARYLGAWSDRVSALTVIGVPFGPAVDKEFDQYINELAKKWEPVVRAYNEGTLADKQRKAAIKGRMPMILACFQAMRDWPSVEPGDAGCPTLLLAGAKNKRVIDWVSANRQALDSAGVYVKVIQGLNHPQEFSAVDRVFPVVSSFFKDQTWQPSSTSLLEQSGLYARH